MNDEGEESLELTAALETQFNRIGLSLYDDNQQFKSTFEIFQDLAGIWPTLTQEAKAYYAELIAGKTQSNVVIAILDNFQTAIDATATALDSAGSAARENAKVLDSLTGHIQALKAEWESLINSQTVQDTAKFLVDVLKGLLSIVNALGGLRTILIAIIALNLPKISSLIINTFISLGKFLSQFYQNFMLAGGVLSGLSNAFRAAFTNAQLFTGGVLAAVTALGFLINKLIESKRKQEEYNKALLDNHENNKKILEIVGSNIDRYEELANKINRTTSEEEELNSIETQLIGVLGDKNELLERLTKGTDNYREAVKNLSIEEAKRARRELLEAKDVATENMRKASIRGLGSDLLGATTTGSPALKILEASGMLETTGAEGYSNIALSGLPDIYSRLSKGQITREQAGAEIYETYSNALKKLNDQIELFISYGQDEVASAIQKDSEYKIISDTVDELSTKYNDLMYTTYDYIQSVQGGDNALIDSQKEYNALIQKIKENNSLTDLQKQTLIELSQKTYPDFSKAVGDAGIKLLIENEALDKLISILEKGSKSYGDISSAIAEYNEKGSLSAKTLLDMKEKYPEYLKYLQEHGFTLENLNEYLKGNSDELLDQARATVEANYKTEIFNLTLKDFGSTVGGAIQRVSELNAIIKRYNDGLAEINDIEKILKKNDWVNETTKGAKTVNTKIEETDAILSSLQEHINAINHEIKMLEYQGADSEQIIAKYRELQEETHKMAERYRELDAEKYKEEINKLSEQWWEYDKDIKKIQKDIYDDITDKFNKIKDAAKDAIDEQIKEKQEALETQNDLIDEEIEKRKTELDALENEADAEDRLLKIEEARKKLADAKSQKVRVYREGRGFVYETDFDAVSQAQTELDDILKEWNLFQEKAKINNIIDKLEAEKKANKERVEQEVKDLNTLKDAWDKSLDLEENLGEYETYLDKLEEMESASFNERLELVKDFVSAYNSELSLAGVSELAGTSSGERKATGSRIMGGAAVYDSNTDYQALINEAESKGNIHDAAIAEALRNTKIDIEGLPYEKTHKYTDPVTNVPVGLASGTTNADGRLHLVGENGPELYVPPKGSGIIPNVDTMNLMAWSSLNPLDLVKNFAAISSNSSISINNVNLPNVSDVDGFINALENLKTDAIQYQSLRR